MMYPSQEARELAILLRISRELDICGDVTATVDNPSEILAWATILPRPHIRAWRAQDSGHRYIQVSADRQHAPVRGHVAAVLDGEHHQEFWTQCGLSQLEPGDTHELSAAELARAWEAMPITPADALSPPRPPPPAWHEPASRSMTTRSDRVVTARPDCEQTGIPGGDGAGTKPVCGATARTSATHRVLESARTVGSDSPGPRSPADKARRCA